MEMVDDVTTQRNITDNLPWMTEPGGFVGEVVKESCYTTED